MGAIKEHYHDEICQAMQEAEAFPMETITVEELQRREEENKTALEKREGKKWWEK